MLQTTTIAIFSLFISFLEFTAEGACPPFEKWKTVPCSTTCGNGIRRRIAICDNGDIRSQTKSCYKGPCPIDGRWRQWSVFKKCVGKCGTGTQKRTRTCINPKHGGKSCSGSKTNHRKCALRPCPIDGVWSDWIPHGSCSAQRCCGGIACNEGYQLLVRLCNSPQPRFNGKQCKGFYISTQPCYNNESCPEWSDWSAWSEHCVKENELNFAIGRIEEIVECDDEGEQLPVIRRTRNCTSDGPRFRSLEDKCQGSNKETDVCQELPKCENVVVATGAPELEVTTNKYDGVTEEDIFDDIFGDLFND